ncbi:MAG: T9SS type A sorting domain-containing protein [Jejuia sp.]
MNKYIKLSALLYITGFFGFSQQIIQVNNYQELLSAKSSIRGGGESVVIELSGGIYYLDETLVFDELDGRSGSSTVTYKSAENASAVLSGGYLIDGTWTQVTGKGYYKISIPQSAPLDKIQFSRNLFVNGKRAKRSKSGPVTIRGTYGAPGPMAGFTVTASNIPEFSKPQFIELNQLVRFRDHYYRVLSMNAASGINGDAIYQLEIKNLNWARFMSLSMCPGSDHQELDVPFYFENAIELLDEPGEWFYDPEMRELYYYPKSDEDINTLEFILPILDRLISVYSPKDQGNKVSNINFEGLTLAHTNWEWTSKEGFLTLQGSNTPIREYAINADRGTAQPLDKKYIDAAVHLDGANNINFKKNYFNLLGGNGLNIHNNSENINVLSNSFENISGSGIRVSSSFNMTIGDTSNLEGPVSHIMIANNFIHQIGLEYKGCIGIEFMYTDNITVKHNEIKDTPYIGISAGYGWEGSFSDNSVSMKDAEISYNRVENAMNTAKEGGSIYTLNRFNFSSGKNYGLEIKNNYILETVVKSSSQAPIHNDEGTHQILIYKNVIDSPRPNYQWTHNACSIDITDNIVNYGAETYILGQPKRDCSLQVNVTGTGYVNPYDGIESQDEITANQIIATAGIQQGQEPPNFTLSNLKLESTPSILSFYPNPVKDSFYIEIEKTILYIEIFDFSGKKLKVFSGNLIRKNRFDVSELSKGYYFIKLLIEGEGLKYLKFIKE